ncbi:hypothetical protein ACP70R_011549 [Stipagrostis hirtigluma subsp. patula]
MASMITGDFAEAYVLRNACKEKLRRMAEANAVDGEAAAAQGKKQEEGARGASGEKTAEEAAGSKGDGAGCLGLAKNKVHPKVGGNGASS